MSRALLAAVIGCGSISEMHTRAIRELPGVQLCAVCDCKGAVAASTGGALGVPYYTDVDTLLSQPELDVVHLCLPHWLHAPVAIKAAAAGKQILTEKPVATTLSDALDMQTAATAAGVTLGVCFQNRYNPATRYMQEVVTAGTLGRVLGGRATVFWDRGVDYYKSSDWRGRLKTEGGGALINQSIHTLDLLQLLIGAPVVELTANVSTKRLSGTIEVEDTADVLLQFQNGARAVFFATNCFVGNAPVELEIVFERGSVRLIGETVTRTEGGVTTAVSLPGMDTAGEKAYWGSGHRALIADFYRCLQTGERFPIGVAQAAVSLQLIQSIYQSSQIGGPVQVPALKI